MSDCKISILHLYPDLLNLYGDKGNIEVMRRRLVWRGIDAEVFCCKADNDNVDFSEADIIFLGGGSERETEIVCKKLKSKKDELLNYVENGGSLVALCSGYEILGHSFQTAEKTVEGLGILDIYTEFAEKKLIGNTVIECDGLTMPVVGFENHNGRMNTGSYAPLGKTVKGFGNDGKSGFEGVVYKNVTATYIHGPLFPKNPQLCDRVLQGALKHKYRDFEVLTPINDELEEKANRYMISRG